MTIRRCIAVLAFALPLMLAMLAAHAAPTQAARATQVAKSASQRQAQQEAAEELKIQLQVEQALYLQPALLDRQLNALLAPTPGRINAYFIGVGGDGTQEVFRREIEYVKELFDQRFGTRGRSVLLTNSRSTIDRWPMATVTSLRRSLQAVAAKMDKSRDILFLYLTSHGSRDHVLSLEQEGMLLRGLGKQELATMLRDTGIRWKVVVVGACYAGGFIAPLQDAHTMVITAARADRSSFGCEDENDFTYFGRAFFKDALPHAASFSEAFGIARQLVRERETRLFGRSRKANRAYSEPQMYEPAEVGQHLADWRKQGAATH